MKGTCMKLDVFCVRPCNNIAPFVMVFRYQNEHSSREPLAQAFKFLANDLPTIELYNRNN